MNFELTAGSLSLRPIDGKDVDALHSLWTDREVRRFLWDGEEIPFEQTNEIVQTNSGLFEESGLGLWGVRAAGSSELVGFSGFWHFRTPPSLELLFGVSVDHWGRRIATESSRRVIEYGFDVLGFEQIEASSDVENIASDHVLRNLDMIHTRRAVVDGLDTNFYRLERSD